MSKKIKSKRIPKEQFEKWFRGNCNATVILDYDIWPSWAKKARKPEVDHILFWPVESSQSGKTYNFKTTHGTLTVLRYDPKDVSKGFSYNKDVYVYVCASDDTVRQFGPFSKGEPDHWMHDISDEYKGWSIVSNKEKDNKKTQFCLTTK